MDFALVQAAGPGAPPALPGGEPETDAAAFGAVIDPLLAADGAAAAAEAGAGVSSPVGQLPTNADAGSRLAAFAETSGAWLPVTESADMLGASLPETNVHVVDPALDDDAPEDPAADDADASAAAMAAAAAIPVPVALPIVDATIPTLPLGVTLTADSTPSSGAEDGPGGVTAVADASAAPASTAAPTAAPAAPAANARDELPGGSRPVAGDTPLAVDLAPAQAPTVPSADGPETRTPAEARSSEPSASPAVIDAGVRAEDVFEMRTASQPDRVVADAPTRVAEDRQPSPSAQPAPATESQTPEETRTSHGRRATGDGRHGHPSASPGALRLAAQLAAQFPPTAAASVPGSSRPVDAGLTQHGPGAPVPENPTPPWAAMDTASTDEIAAVRRMDGTAFGDASGSDTAHAGNNPAPGGSGQGATTPVVPAAAPAGWTGWPAGQLPAAAAVALGHATSTDDPVVPQLVKALHVQLRNGVGEARVQLEPHHLGAVSVALRVDNGVVSAVITAEQPAVRHWLEAHESSLRGALAEQGLQLDRLRVEPDGQQAGGRASTGQEPPPRRRMLRKETATFELVA